MRPMLDSLCYTTLGWRRVVAVVLVLAAGLACAPEDTTVPGGRSAARPVTGSQEKAPRTPKNARSEAASQSPRRVDPRRGGFSVGLGEWAVTLESRAIRPGPVSFVVANRGTMAHGFEIEAESVRDDGGSGSGFKSESHLLAPGKTMRVRLELAPGSYKIECLVDGHDDRGMETMLRVDKGASYPKVRPEKSGTDGLEITNFAFEPTSARVERDATVEWTNMDPAPHTVTAIDGSFDSGTLEPGESYRVDLRRPGRHRYRCEIHPEMKGSIEVAG